MNEKVAKFYEVVSADGMLKEELVAVTEGVDLEGLSEEEARLAMAEAFAAFAAAHDLDLTADDVLEAHEAVSSGELSEEELAAIGGGSGFCLVFGDDHRCGCILGGGGKHTDPPAPASSLGFTISRCELAQSGHIRRDGDIHPAVCQRGVGLQLVIARGLGSAHLLREARVARRGHGNARRFNAALTAAGLRRFGHAPREHEILPLLLR